MLIDSHSHLDMKHFDPDRDQLVARALSADARQRITAGIDIISSLPAVILTKIYPSVFASIGSHPNNTNNTNKNDFEQILMMAKKGKNFVIDEIELDFFSNRLPRQKQIELVK
jgi:TatD DNase family protein